MPEEKVSREFDRDLSSFDFTSVQNPFSLPIAKSPGSPRHQLGTKLLVLVDPVPSAVCSIADSLLSSSCNIDSNTGRDFETGLTGMLDIPFDFVIEKCLLLEILLSCNQNTSYAAYCPPKLVQSLIILQLLEERTIIGTPQIHFMELADWADLFIMSLWHHEHMHTINQNGGSGSYKSEVLHFNIFMKLRQQVNHFVTTLQQYVQSQLSHVCWCKFLHSLKNQVKDMMDFESAHMSYVNDSLTICFLSDETTVESGDSSSNFSQTNISQVHNIRRVFYNNLKELYICYLKSPKHGEFSLSRFWDCLNYNDYYAEVIGTSQARLTIFHLLHIIWDFFTNSLFVTHTKVMVRTLDEGWNLEDIGSSEVVLVWILESHNVLYSDFTEVVSPHFILHFQLEKVGQMTQIERKIASPDIMKQYYIGSILSGGGSVPAPKASAETWAWNSNALWYRTIDAIHGHNNVYGATIFPHNVGLGVTRDPELVKKIGDATALQVRATGIPYTFAPCIATKVVACAKHFVGDGGTVKGIDENNTVIDFNHLLRIHMPAYLDSIRKGVVTVMVSYSSWNGKKMHGNRDLVTGFLKDKLKFRGFVISDWQGIDKITSPPHSNYSYSVQAGVQAGIDMMMVPENFTEFVDDLIFQVKNKIVPMSRIDDAVKRILRVKFVMGNQEEHRQLAREAVRKSLVLLKNGKTSAAPLLPLPKKAPKILVAGTHANDLGYHCGGWTIEWQGLQGNDHTIGTIILTAVTKVVYPSTKVIYNEILKLTT
ncbi:hypothetical protein POM88_047322 [Heracleum sosnowskyi]|uniref:beta-glucosidase n=1 Tax=Heracleum sosnowskyi TaxID=360622 RepID=A0AAD8GT04_9APIA|nr:hypothetical protein POM88_047322 [Heracleum sosnowskyi]